MNITLIHQPSLDMIHDLRQRRLFHNGNQIQGYAYEEVMFRIEDNQGVLAAGMLCQIGGGWLYIDSLWVREERRGQGLGATLLARAEQTAFQENCHGLYLYTYSFQSPQFYLKAGYEIFGALEPFCGTHSKMFMKKRLA